MEEAIQVFDFKRMFIGDESSAFLLEIAFRTAFMYLYTILLMRSVGKRGMGQLAPFELVIIIALGSAVGDPTFYPDVPLTHAMVVVAVIIVLQRGLVLATERSTKAAAYIESEPRRLVADGIVDLDALAAERFGRDELFETLREEGVEQLGQVKRAYLEPSGRVSVWLFPRRDIRPGLHLVPRNDPDWQAPAEPGEAVAEAAIYACCACGLTQELAAGEITRECPLCGLGVGWFAAFGDAQDGDGSGGAPGSEGGGPDDDRRRRRRATFGS